VVAAGGAAGPGGGRGGPARGALTGLGTNTDQAVTDTFKVVFQDNDSDLATIHLGTGYTVNTTTLGMDPLARLRRLRGRRGTM